MTESKGRALIPLVVDNGSSLVLIPDQELNSQQAGQLDQAIGKYLKVHNLSRSYDNVQKSRGAIRSCMEEGLRATKGNIKIEPGDNLLTSFEAGLKQRRFTLSAAQQIVASLPGTGTYQGELALPASIITPCQAALSRPAFTTDLRSCRQVTEIAAIRRPIFEKILSFARRQVEEVIPESTKVELKPEQEASLVRNLLFAWVVFQKPLPLLETEDFMLNSQEYARELGEKGKNPWQDLAAMVGIDSPETILYLEQLGKQVEELTAGIPQGVTSDPDKIDSAFRRLTPNFLIVNPFFKLTDLSENLDDPESIWDKNHAQTVVIGEAAYRIPYQETLVLASYRKDPKRKSQLQQAAALTQRLFREISEQEADPSIPTFQKEIGRHREVVKELPAQIRRGEIPPSAILSKSELKNYAQVQGEIIDDEMQLFSNIRSFTAGQLTTAYTLLQKYRDGRCVTDSREFPVLMDLYRAPSYVYRTLLHFLRERSTERLKTFHDIHATTTLDNFLATRNNYIIMDRYYEKALQTTVIDILRQRSAFFMTDFTKPVPDLSNLTGGQAKLIRRELVQNMREQLMIQLMRRAPYITGYSKRAYATKHMESLLGGDNDPLRVQYNEWQELKKRFKGGHQIYDLSVIPQGFYTHLVHLWKDRRTRDIKDALASWHHNNRYYAEGSDDLPKNTEREPGQKAENLPGRLATQPYEPALLLIRTIIRLSPHPLDLGILPNLSQLTQYPMVELDKDPSADKPGRKDLINFIEGNLATRNISLDKDTLTNALSSYVLDAALSSMKTMAIFFHVEPEIKTWLSNILSRTADQLKKDHRILRSDPIQIVSEAKRALAIQESRLRDLEGKRHHALTSRLKQLQRLGVVLSEEDFSEK